MSTYEKLSSARREFIKNSGLLIACNIAGEVLRISPAEAARRSVPMHFFTDAEARTLGHFAETMVPGAVAAGVVNFVDSQLAGDPNDSLLIARYFDIPPPHRDFYRRSLTALDRLAHARHAAPYAALDSGLALSLAADLLKAPAPEWKGPSGQLFYLCVRSDAVDVVYGTPAGFEALGIPYMQHILPPRTW
jgi:Gluconate 2-dehydrogenase subunit 3